MGGIYSELKNNHCDTDKSRLDSIIIREIGNDPKPYLHVGTRYSKATYVIPVIRRGTATMRCEGHMHGDGGLLIVRVPA